MNTHPLTFAAGFYTGAMWAMRSITLLHLTPPPHHPTTPPPRDLGELRDPRDTADDGWHRHVGWQEAG